MSLLRQSVIKQLKLFLSDYKVKIVLKTNIGISVFEEMSYQPQVLNI